MSPPPRPAERELFPGVYFTPRPSAAPRPTTLPPTDIQDLSLDELHTQHAALLSSVAKLRASNSQIRQFDPQHRDSELVQAVGENIEIIARRLAQAQQLQKRIDELCPSSCEKDAEGDQQSSHQEPDQGLYL